MKKFFSVIMAVIISVSISVPSFAEFGDYSNKTYKFCPDPECSKINSCDATECRKCNGTLDESHVIINGNGDLPEGYGGYFLRCPECDWVNFATQVYPDQNGECRYCDADIRVCLDDVNAHFFYVRFLVNCPGCNVNIVSDDNTFSECQFCGYKLSEDKNLIISRFTGDPLDPNANWDNITDDPETVEDMSFLQRIINAIVVFFKSIISFFVNLF